jgi:hypothetical protein
MQDLRVFSRFAIQQHTNYKNVPKILLEDTMRKKFFAKETIESFILLVILSLICASSGIVLGLKWKEQEHEKIKNTYAKKLDHCVGKKLEGYHYNEDAFFKNAVRSKTVSNVTR